MNLLRSRTAIHLVASKNDSLVPKVIIQERSIPVDAMDVDVNIMSDREVLKLTKANLSTRLITRTLLRTRPHFRIDPLPFSPAPFGIWI